MRRVVRPLAMLVAALMILSVFMSSVLVPSASAQDFDEIVRELEQNGYYIEPGAEGSDSRFRDLVEQGDATGSTWYFVSLDGSVSGNYADDLFETLSPQGNVLLYFLDSDGFANVQFATDESVSAATQRGALEPFDDDWAEPEDFMEDVVEDFTSLTSTSTSAGSGSGSSGSTAGSSGSSSDTSSGGGFPWGWVLIPLLLIGGVWFMSRRGKKKSDGEDLETAQKIRAELQTELDELANDVLVLSGPVDLAENGQVTTYYREATDTYLDISDELPDVAELENANLQELSELGTRVAHARWQMDAAEALISGEPVPEKPKVPPPPRPAPAPRTQQRPRARQMPQRQPRPRVPYSRSRRRSGGGLLDILIAGAGMMGGRRGGGMFGGGGRSSGRRGGGMFGGGGRSSGGRGGGMFGGSSPGRSSRSRSQPRSGGGVFGGGGRSSRGRSSRSTRSSSGRRPRTSARRSRSTSRRRRRR